MSPVKNSIADRRVFVLERDAIDSVAQYKRLAIVDVSTGLGDDRQTLRQAVVGINAAREGCARLSGRKEHSVIHPFANFDLVGPIKDLVGRQIRVIDEARIRRRARHHLAAFGKANDDVVDVDAFMDVIESARGGSGISRRRKRAAIRDVSKLVTLQIAIEAKRPGVADRMADDANEILILLEDIADNATLQGGRTELRKARGERDVRRQAGLVREHHDVLRTTGDASHGRIDLQIDRDARRGVVHGIRHRQRDIGTLEP